ncbi:hypothetical protein ACF061_00985 [Streptomyces sp. NPDC015220]|uniref:hypothetical protein n=1 Tax=Streptomyces sp. NPDC015220 TaxID=3364947 RepID=UPI0036FF8ED2
MTDQTAPTITPNPDGDGVILHLPEITHVDTQVWSADVGLTAEGLAALRTLLGAPAVQQPPVDRAATFASVRPHTLSSIARHLEARAVAILRPESQTYAEWQTVAAELRRMADEARPVEHQPPSHRWAAEFRDPVADEWIPGTRFLNRHHAVQRYEAAIQHAPAWKDGTPVERRLVRETTTYTVEAEHQPADEARQGGAHSG